MPNFAMWRQALLILPRISPQQWQELDWVSRWLVASRAAVLVMTLTSAVIAGLLALSMGKFDIVLFGLASLGLCLAHATNNLINDLVDFLTGVDADNYLRTQYGSQTVQSGLLSVNQLFAYAAITGALALMIGLYFIALRGMPVLWLVAAGAFFVLFYTWPLKHFGLGEPAVLLVWGPLMVGGTFYVISGQWQNGVAITGLAYALGPTAVLFGKHIDKLDADRDKGIRTLPVILGERYARYCTVSMLLLQQALIVYLVISAYVSPVVLVTLLALPSLYKVYRIFSKPRPQEPPPGTAANAWPLYMVAAAFWYTRRFGGLMILGLVLDVLANRFH